MMNETETVKYKDLLDCDWAIKKNLDLEDDIDGCYEAMMAVLTHRCIGGGVASDFLAGAFSGGALLAGAFLAGAFFAGTFFDVVVGKLRLG